MFCTFIFICVHTHSQYNWSLLCALVPEPAGVLCWVLFDGVSLSSSSAIHRSTGPITQKKITSQNSKHRLVKVIPYGSNVNIMNSEKWSAPYQRTKEKEHIIHRIWHWDISTAFNHIFVFTTTFPFSNCLPSKSVTLFNVGKTAKHSATWCK